MFQQMKKRIKNEKGLTLIELLAVIVILAIVAAIAIPAIGNIIDNSRIKTAKADVVNVLNGANIYFTENPSDKEANATELAPYIENWGVLDSVKSGVTVTKANPNTLSSTSNVTVGNKTVTISGATISNLEVDKAKSTTSFKFD